MDLCRTDRLQNCSGNTISSDLNHVSVRVPMRNRWFTQRDHLRSTHIGFIFEHVKFVTQKKYSNPV